MVRLFQSTLPRGERPAKQFWRTPWLRFNPRSRGGATTCISNFSRTKTVSIHAPAGGATAETIHEAARASRFNPRSRGGATRWWRCISYAILGFNPRSRGGSDIPLRYGMADGEAVSIHAPAGGATFSIRPKELISIRFQSTLPRGERQEGEHGTFSKRGSFNPRSRGGSDTPPLFMSRYHCSFNPRSRGGSDVLLPLLPVVLSEFQSTLPRGERLPWRSHQQP